MPTIYATTPRNEADRIATRLVEERLAACVNRIDCQSVYRWDGEIHDDPETILLVKTTDAGVDAVTQRIEQLHPYDVPCIEQFDEEDVYAPFEEWIGGAVDT